MKATRQLKLIAALEARGYVPHYNLRSSRYAEFVPSPTVRANGGSLLKSDTLYYRILVGKSGALRHTTGSIGDSVPFSDTTVARLICEGEEVLKKG